ncbi:adenylate/guanylate cyclase domain-containing protein [bacterium]|nr:adenylate/guanylate cyclase domain-containing protein [bacterium]
MEEESTLKLDTGANKVPWIETDLEVLVVDPQGRESIWPITRASMQVGSAANPRPNDIILDGPGAAERQSVLQIRNQAVMFLNFDQSNPARKGGQPITYCEFLPGEEIEVGGYRLRLQKHLPAAASLVGYSHPYRGRRWLLRSGSNMIGRSGKRDNQVVLEERTVSRTHATLSGEGDHYVLHNECDPSATFVNGHPVKVDTELKDGDLIQFGAQIVRFCPGKKPVQAAETRHGTVLFADIWNYDKLTESGSLDQFVRQAADFYEMVSRVVDEHQGVLATYLGDAVVAIFESEKSAADSALELLEQLDQMNALWSGASCPSLQVGIGLHTGDIVLGDMSLRGRSEYAAVGAQANLAAEIEGYTRQKKVRILVSETAARSLQSSHTLTSRGTVAVEGGRLEVFELGAKS